jgi:hypothetical protein
MRLADSLANARNRLLTADCLTSIEPKSAVTRIYSDSRNDCERQKCVEKAKRAIRCAGDSSELQNAVKSCEH